MELTSVLAGLFGGVGATLLWEVVIKPMRERRSIAEVLAAEISINLQFLGADKVLLSAKKVNDIKLSTSVYTAVLPRLGDLPPNLVGEIVFLYKYFEEINEHPKIYAQLVEELRTSPGHKEAIEGEIAACINVHNSYVPKAIHRINLNQKALLTAAFPWWSTRLYSKRPPQGLTYEELEGRIAKSQEERDKLRSQFKGKENEGS